MGAPSTPRVEVPPAPLGFRGLIWGVSSTWPHPSLPSILGRTPWFPRRWERPAILPRSVAWRCACVSEGRLGIRGGRLRAPGPAACLAQSMGQGDLLSAPAAPGFCVFADSDSVPAEHTVFLT